MVEPTRSQTIELDTSRDANPNVEIDSVRSTYEDGTVWRRSSQISRKRLHGIWASIVIFETVGVIKFSDMWYQNPTTSFHFKEFKQDLRLFQQMDKLSHMMSAYAISDAYSKAYRWAGYSVNTSIAYGSLTGWLMMLQIELTDGFFEEWGFSWGDLIANSAGVGCSAIRQLFPHLLRGVQLKFSYHPSRAFKKRQYVPEVNYALGDYEGMTFWLAINLHDYAPQGIKSRFPAWLTPVGIAVGRSAEGIAQNAGGGRRVVFIGLDYDINKIKLGNNRLVNFIKSELGMIRLNLPTVQISGSAS